MELVTAGMHLGRAFAPFTQVVKPWRIFWQPLRHQLRKKTYMAHLEQTSAHISKLPEAFSSFWPFLPGCLPSRREKLYFPWKFWAIHVPPLFTYHMHSWSFVLVMAVSGFSAKAEASHSAFSDDFRVAEVNIKLNYPACIAKQNGSPHGKKHGSPKTLEICGQTIL